VQARAVRFVAPRCVEIQRVAVRPPGRAEVLVGTRWSGISGGSELLAYRGEIDPDLARDETVRALAGSFEYPFAYGYSCVGVVVRSLADGFAEGDVVFAFHPHQDRFTARVDDVVRVEGVDERLATLFPLLETALQVALDAGPRLDETVVVLGLGPVGILVATLLVRAGAEVLGVDPRDDRREAAHSFGVRAVDAPAADRGVRESTEGRGASLLIEATGQPTALGPALALLRHEGEALVCSWFGNKDVPLPLGREFHRRRLQIRSTQVSTIPARLSARWDVPRRRLVAARLMSELPLKALATHDVPFERAADAYAALDRGDRGLMHAALAYE
jgi:2-desacetyl-2-hydroxyethyl bacteriochlorophyllide A dehydrogenase